MQSSRTIFQSVSRHVQAGQLPKAIAELQRGIISYPKDLRLPLKLAALLQHAGKPEDAVTQLASLAKRYEEEGFGLKAMGCWIQVRKLQPEHKEAPLALAKHYSSHGLYAKAAELYALALSQAKDEVSRLSIIEGMLDLDPENLVDRLILAEKYSAIGHLADASKHLRIVLENLEKLMLDTTYTPVAERLLYHDPNDASIAKHLASIYMGHDEPQQALPKLKTAYEDSPEDLDILELLVEVFKQLGQTHKAIAVLKEMARLYDKNSLMQDRDRCWGRVLELDPNDPDAKNILMPSRENMGDTIELSHALTPSPGGTESSALSGHFEGTGDAPGFTGDSEHTLMDEAFISPELQDGVLDFKMNQDADHATAMELQENLLELDFYLNNALSLEAEVLLQDLRERFGKDNPLLEKRAQKLQDLK